MSFLRDGYDDVDMQSSLREENLDLKRKLNAQVEVTKKLNTRVQKMSEDMAKLKIRASVIPVHEHSRPGSAMSQHPPPPHGTPLDPFYHAPAHQPKPHHSSAHGPTVVAARTIIHKRNPSLEALVDDLRDQLRDLAKENSSLKTKVQHYKSLHEATLRKRGKWDAIGPKVPSSRGPGGHVAKSPMKSAATSVGGSLANLFPVEKPQAVRFTEAAEYQDMVNTIQNLKHTVKSKDEQLADATSQIDQLARALKIAEAKASVEPDTTEVMVLKQQVATLEARQRAMTLDATNKTRLVEELLERCAHLESTDLANRQRVTELTGQLAHVTGDLDASQTRVADLETQVAQANVDVQTMDHLRRIIQDLKTERQLAQDENARLIAATLDSQQSARARLESAMQDVHKKLAHAESTNRQLLLDTKRHLDDLDLAKSQVTALTQRLADANTRADRAEHDLATLKKRVAIFAETNHVSAGDIQEALVLVAWRRQHGIALDTLLSMHEWVKDKAGALHLRREYLSALHDLDRTRQLLALQTEVNGEYKAELAGVQASLDELRDEYARRREMDARALDARQTRIAHLERQLRQALVHAPTAAGAGAAGEEAAGLGKGPTLVCKVHSWSLVPGAKIKAPTVVLFVLDFFTFDSIVSPLAPIMSTNTLALDEWTAAWPLESVGLSDALFWYLESGSTSQAQLSVDVVTVRADGTFVTLGTAGVHHLAQLLRAGTSGLQYTINVWGEPGIANEWVDVPASTAEVDPDTGKMVVGQIKCSVAMSLTLEEAWVAYQERTQSARVASTAVTVGGSGAEGKMVQTQPTPVYKTDTLVVSVTRVDVPTKTRDPNVYALVDVYHRTGLRLSCPDRDSHTPNPSSTSSLTLPLVLAPDVVTWLSTKPMIVSLFDDSDPDDASSFMGQARVELAGVLSHESVQVEAEVVLNGAKVGIIKVQLGWQSCAPVVVDASGDLNFQASSRDASQQKPSVQASTSTVQQLSRHASQQKLPEHDLSDVPPLLTSVPQVTVPVLKPSSSSSASATPTPTASGSRLLATNLRLSQELAEQTPLPPSESSSLHSAGRKSSSTTHMPIQNHPSLAKSVSFSGRMQQARTISQPGGLVGSPSSDLPAQPQETVPGNDAYNDQESVYVTSANVTRQGSARSVVADEQPLPPSDGSRASLLESALLRTSSKLLQRSREKLDADVTDGRLAVATIPPMLDDGEEAAVDQHDGGEREAAIDEDMEEMGTYVGHFEGGNLARADMHDWDSEVPVREDDAGHYDAATGDEDALHIDTDAADQESRPDHEPISPNVLLSPSITESDRAALSNQEDDHVTIMLHTLRVNHQSAVVEEHLGPATKLILAFDLFGDESSGVETTARFLRDPDTNALVDTIDLGLVASFPIQDEVDASRWQQVLLSGQPSAFIAAIQVHGDDEHEEHDGPIEFMDMAAGQLFWEHVVETSVAHQQQQLSSSSSAGSPGSPPPPMVFALDMDFLDGHGSLGTLAVEVHGLHPLLSRLGMAGEGLVQTVNQDESLLKASESMIGGFR